MTCSSSQRGLGHEAAAATSCAALAGAEVTGAYIGVVNGRPTFDLGLGRRTRPLGPLHLNIATPCELSSPPLPRRTQIDRRGPIREKSMVLAAHRTPVVSGLTAVTTSRSPRGASVHCPPCPT
jgi:hypothetical protein